MQKDSSTNDYSLSRVPRSSKYPMWKLTLIRFGALASISQFMLGAELGYGMSLSEAFWSVFVGSLLLQFIALGLGYAGQREGLTTSLLAKWTGFGSLGSGILSVLFAISMVGWFGIQNSIFAQGIVDIIKKPQWMTVISILTGLAVTIIVVFGLKALSWTANISVPGFLILIGICAYQMLRTHSLGQLATMTAPGPHLGFTAGVTMVTGGFIIGCIISPDYTRYAKAPKDVFWITTISVFGGEIGINLISVLLAHAVGTSQIMPIAYKLSGAFGIILVILSTVKINDANLYSSSLNIVNFIKEFFHVNVNRGITTFIIGVLGTILSVTGILNKFTQFLTILGIVFPPVTGIMVIDYFVLKRSRQRLDASKAQGKLPDMAERFNPVTIIAWVLGSLAGQFITVGIPSITSLIVSAIVYYVGIKLFYSKEESQVPDKGKSE